jgi:hypothetical protein
MAVDGSRTAPGWAEARLMGDEAGAEHRILPHRPPSPRLFQLAGV